MILILLLSVFIEQLFHQNLRDVLLPLSENAQSFCASRFHGETLAPLADALVCGVDLSGSPIKNLFIDLGLYHVLVVSGAHLTVVSSLIVLFAAKLRRPYVIFLLFLYCVVTGLQAPVVRALIQLILRLRAGERPTRPVDILFSYLYALAFYPKWITSLSLHLSTVAVLIVTAPFPRWSKNALVFCAALPLILNFGTPSPLNILTATLLSPLLEALLFPLCALLALFPMWQPGADQLAQAFVQALSEIRSLLPVFDPEHTISLRHWSNCYVAFTWWWVTLYCIHRERRWVFPS